MQATHAQISSPNGTFVSSCGEVYFADYGNSKIRKILRDGRIVSIANCSYPQSVFVSQDGQVFLTDSYERKVKKIKQDGTMTVVAGNGGRGSGGDGGLATSSTLNYPIECIVHNNELFVLENTGNRVRKVDQNGIISTVAGNGSTTFVEGATAKDTGFYNPCSFHISPRNEIYVADTNNHSIRKISVSGIVSTIAGTGIGGDASINSPCNVFYFKGEVFFTEASSRIRKIQQDRTVVTIAGNGTKGYSGDNGPALNAQINNPTGLFVSSQGIFFSDTGNHRIRKIQWNGTITTIAGTGLPGYSGDSPFDIKLYPHRGLIATHLLKKHSRDKIGNTEIVGFLPLIKKRSLGFYKFLLLDGTISRLDATDHAIIQYLIDSLIYEESYSNWVDNFDTLQVLYILGFFESGFAENINYLLSKFVNSATCLNLPTMIDTIENYLQKSKALKLTNTIITMLHNFCLESCAIYLKSASNMSLLGFPSVIRNQGAILRKVCMDKPTPLFFKDDNSSVEDLEDLFNDKTSSDVKIKKGDNDFIYCHKTVLASGSAFFNSMFESGREFMDFSDGTITPDSNTNIAILELIVKYCYGIVNYSFEINTNDMLPLIDMALLHDIHYLIELCDSKFIVTIDNFFTLSNQFRHYVHLEAFNLLFNRLVDFAVANRKVLFGSAEKVAQLPCEIHVGIITKLSQ